MQVNRYYPTGPLRNYVKSYTVIKSREGHSNILFPDTSISMAFISKGAVSYKLNEEHACLSVLGVTGIRSRYREVVYARESINTVVAFHDLQSRFFFDAPLHTIADESVALEDLFNRNRVRRTADRLSSAQTDQQRISCIEDLLMQEFKNHNRDDLVEEAIRILYQCGGEIRILDLMKKIPLSRDAFEKRFRQQTGTSPKHFATIVRFRTAIAHPPASMNLTQIAHAAGYYDQAHFIREFRQFAGTTPGQYFRTRKAHQ